MRRIFSLVTLLCFVPNLDAGIITLSTDSTLAGPFAGAAFTVDTPLLNADGVDFTARLTVTGNGATVENNSNGIGVDGTTVNNGESLFFAVTILTEIGGTVSFDGFTSIDFNSYTVGGADAGSINGTLLVNTNLNEFSLTGAPFLTPQTLTVSGLPPFSGTTSFQIDDVTLSFTGTAAIPEPSSLVFLSAGAMLTVASRCKRRKRYELDCETKQ